MLLYKLEVRFTHILSAFCSNWRTHQLSFVVLCKNTIALENSKMIEPLIKSDTRIFLKDFHKTCPNLFPAILKDEERNIIYDSMLDVSIVRVKTNSSKYYRNELMFY